MTTLEKIKYFTGIYSLRDLYTRDKPLKLKGIQKASFFLGGLIVTIAVLLSINPFGIVVGLIAYGIGNALILSNKGLPRSTKTKWVIYPVISLWLTWGSLLIALS